MRSCGRIAVLMCLVGWITASGARAETWARGDIRHPITRGEMRSFVEILGFDNAQKEAAQAIYEGYWQGHRRALKLIEKELDRTRGTAENNSTRISRRIYLQEVLALEHGVYDDLVLLATDAQKEALPKLRRAIRRGRVYDSTAAASLHDLIAVAEVPPEVVAQTGILEEYEIRLDRTLRRIERAREEIQRLQDENNVVTDDEESRLYEELGNLSPEVVKDLYRTVDRMIAQLPSPWNERFESVYWDLCFATQMCSVRPSYTMRLFEAAVAMESLTDDQRETITTMHVEYKREAHEASLRWAKEVRKLKLQDVNPLPAGMVLELERASEKYSDVRPFVNLMAQHSNNKTKKAESLRERRLQVDLEYEQRLRDVLTDAQELELPILKHPFQ